MHSTLLKMMLTFYLFTASQCRINARQRVPTAGVEPSSSNDGMPECSSGHGASVCDGFGWTLFKGKCYKVLEGLMDWKYFGPGKSGNPFEKTENRKVFLTENEKTTKTTERNSAILDRARRGNKTFLVIRLKLSHIIAACKSESAILVCIQNEDENHFVGQLIAKPIERSIENYRLETTLFNTFWIGLNRVKDGDRYISTWVNGEKARFGNLPEITTTVSTTGANHKYPWGEGQPSGANKFTDPTGAKEQCTHMFSADGRWNDAECRVQMSGGVCQKFPK